MRRAPLLALAATASAIVTPSAFAATISSGPPGATNAATVDFTWTTTPPSGDGAFSWTLTHNGSVVHNGGGDTTASFTSLKSWS